MIFPKNGGPLADSSYAFIISFDDMGYVKDNDAVKINYQELLEEMHKEEPAINAERQKIKYCIGRRNCSLAMKRKHTKL